MQLFQDVVFFRTYSQVLADGTKETREDVYSRFEGMLLKKYPEIESIVRECCNQIRAGRVLPSMRALAFAGAPIERENARLYNCSFQNITSFKNFADILYLSACGVGCGYSVQRRHVDQLPIIADEPRGSFTIPDSREGWADSVLLLLQHPSIKFYYSDIRKAGTPLSTGGTASGPEPLIECHKRIREILQGAVGRKLRPIEAHSIACSIGHCIVAGGVRRSAMISLFDANDSEMLAAKSGAWWEKNPHFARANNSAVLHREHHGEAEFRAVMKACFDSKAGEPGVFWTSDWDYGTNPCAEIALRSRGFCNLTEINVAQCKTREEFQQAAIAATILGTLQAGFTDFHYIHDEWKKNAEEEALLGVSITGQAQNWEMLEDADYLKKLAMFLKEVNGMYADKIGINKAARIQTTKPSGTSSSVLGCSSGIHAVHAPYYIRRVRINKMDPLAALLRSKLPEQFVENSPFEPNDDIFCFPMRMPGINRHDETALGLLERVRHISDNWIAPGHRRGPNRHNVSVTISFKDSEQDEITDWMWKNRDSYSGISLLPFSDSTYSYAPYEDISEERYNELMSQFPEIDLRGVVYTSAGDTRSDVAACEGGLCEIRSN